MTLADQPRLLERAFEKLRQRCGGRLRAEHHPRGWGHREGDALRGDALVRPKEIEAAKHAELQRTRESLARLPPWYLAGAPSGNDEFMALADRAAVSLIGHQGGDAWIAWLDKLLAAPIGNRRDFEMDGERVTSIHDVCAVSAQYCRLLATGSPAAQAAGQVDSDSIRTVAAGRKQRIDAYIDQVRLKTGETITRAAIWRTARKDHADCRRWERADKRTRASVGAAIEGVLRDKPHLKLKPKL